MTWSAVLFWILAGSACISAVAMLATQNIVRMAFWLLLSLGATGGLFFLLGADFVGATQLLIYVGGTLVLLIFGVMLTARGPFVSIQTSTGEWLLATVVGSSLLAVILSSALAADWQAVAERHREAAPPAAAPAEGEDPATATALGLALLGAKPGETGYLLVFELASVHLLVVLIGAAYLARAKRRARPPAEEEAPPAETAGTPAPAS